MSPVDLTPTTAELAVAVSPIVTLDGALAARSKAVADQQAAAAVLGPAAEAAEVAEAQVAAVQSQGKIAVFLASIKAAVTGTPVADLAAAEAARVQADAAAQLARDTYERSVRAVEDADREVGGAAGRSYDEMLRDKRTTADLEAGRKWCPVRQAGVDDEPRPVVGRDQFIQRHMLP